MKESNGVKFVLINYLNMYKSRLLNIEISNEIDNINKKKVINDINNIKRFIINNTNKYKYNILNEKYELFSSFDIHNMYEIDDEIYYKNLKNNDFKYLQEVSLYDNSFELFFIKTKNGIIQEVGFIFNFSPLSDLLYKDFKIGINQTISKYLNMFNIKNYEDFENALNNDYNIAIV